METVTAVILSDGKPGHVNQSIALCRLKGWDHRIVKVAYRSRWGKLLSYGFDRMGLSVPSLFRLEETLPSCRVLVGSGSQTYYPLKVLSRGLAVPSVAVMTPRGYRPDFTWIVAPRHDRPPEGENVVVLPINPVLAPDPEASTEGRFVFDAATRYAALIVGGPNGTFGMAPEDLRGVLEALFALEGVRIVVTTSRRTPPGIEAMLQRYPFAYRHLYSHDPFNPIPAFLSRCERVVITADSTSMISEAVVGGEAFVEVAMLPSRRHGKFHRLIDELVRIGAVHLFDGSFGTARVKIDLAPLLGKVAL